MATDFIYRMYGHLQKGMQSIISSHVINISVYLGYTVIQNISIEVYM